MRRWYESTWAHTCITQGYLGSHMCCCTHIHAINSIWFSPRGRAVRWWVGRIPGPGNYYLALLQHPSTPSIPKAFSQWHAQTINQGACSINTIVLVYHFFALLEYPFIPITYIFLYKNSCTTTYKNNTLLYLSLSGTGPRLTFTIKTLYFTSALSQVYSALFAHAFPRSKTLVKIK